MSQNLLKLTVAHVDKPIFDGEVVSVHLPGVEGEMEIMANHEPLISPLKAGVLTIKKADGEQEKHDIVGGTLEVAENHATVLI